MNLPSISIVIPTYNSEKVLPLCLESIKNQDYPKDEVGIIIVDGGSADSTLRRQENLGWEPEVSPREGVAMLASWIEENRKLF